MINPDRVALELFGLKIYWYGVLMAVGIVLAIALAIAEAKRKRMHQDTVLDVCLVLIPCGVVGARLYYVLFELERYLADPIKIFYVWEGGLAIFGAVLGGAIGLMVYSRVKRIRFFRLADIIAPGLVLAQALGRWGNFFNQEAYGLPIDNPDMLWFPFAVRIDGAHFFDFGDGLGAVLCDNPFHLATFFYESMWCLIVFALLWLLIRKRAKHDGDVFLWYVMLYSFERMFVEGLRADSLWLIKDVVRVSQALSLMLFMAVLVFFILRGAREKKLGVLIWPSMPVEDVMHDAASDEIIGGADSCVAGEHSEAGDTAVLSEADEAIEPSEAIESAETIEFVETAQAVEVNEDAKAGETIQNNDDT